MSAKEAIKLVANNKKAYHDYFQPLREGQYFQQRAPQKKASAPAQEGDHEAGRTGSGQGLHSDAAPGLLQERPGQNRGRPRPRQETLRQARRPQEEGNEEGDREGFPQQPDQDVRQMEYLRLCT